MALPTDYDTVEVRGRYTYLTGGPVNGQVKFAGKSIAVSASTKTVIIPAEISAILGTDGEFSVWLPATDDPDIAPNGWTYTVKEAFPGGRIFEIDVPLSAKVNGIDLATVAPTSGASGFPTAFVTLTAYQSGLGAAQTTANNALAATQTAPTVVNVKKYGAVADGATLNDAAIAAALSDVPSQGGVLFFPRGTYNIAAPVTARSNLIIRGEGRSATRLVQTDPNKDGIANTGNGLQYLTIEDIDVRCSAATGTGVGLNLGNNLAASSYLALLRVNVQGFGGTGIYLGRWIASTVTDVRSQGHGGHGFHLDKGTSYTLSGCYALSCQQSGYRLSGSPLNYTTLIATATDSCGIGYDLDTVQGVTMIGCGNESGVNRSASYPGIGIRVNGGSNVGIYQHFAYANTSTGIYLTGLATNVTIVGYRDNTPAGGPGSTSIKTDAGVQAVINDPKIDGVTSYAAGTVASINNGTRSDLVASGSTSVLRATANTGGATNTQPVLHVVGADSSNRAIGAQLGADTNARWMVDINGRTEWGSGVAVRDVALYRKGADLLATDDALFLANQASQPATPSGGGVLFVESGALKFKGSSGTVTTLGLA